MRIYDLQESLDKLIANGNCQVELIGEAGAWTFRVSRRIQDNALQRYVYRELGSGTSPDFLGAYDFIASQISANLD